MCVCEVSIVQSVALKQTHETFKYFRLKIQLNMINLNLKKQHIQRQSRHEARVRLCCCAYE